MTAESARNRTSNTPDVGAVEKEQQQDTNHAKSKQTKKRETNKAKQTGLADSHSQANPTAKINNKVKQGQRLPQSGIA